MSVTLQDLVFHLCHENQRVNDDRWQSRFPEDIINLILKGNYLHFEDIVRMGDVCRFWRRMALDNSVGTPLLNKAGLQPKEDETWIRTYSIWLNTNIFIVLDISGSMRPEPIARQIPFAPVRPIEPWRMETAIEKVRELAFQLEPVMHHNKGIRVTLFADKAVTQCVTSVDELISFVETPHDDLGGGSEFYEALEEVSREHQDLSLFSIKSTLLSTAYVISDMGLNLTFGDLIYKIPRGLNFKFIRIGNCDSGSRLIGELEAGYQAHLQTLNAEPPEVEEQKEQKTSKSRKKKSKKARKPVVKRETPPEIEMSFDSIPERKEKKAKTEIHVME